MANPCLRLLALARVAPYLPFAAASMALYAASMRCDGTTRHPRVARVSGALATFCAGAWS